MVVRITLNINKSVNVIIEIYYYSKEESGLIFEKNIS